MQASVLTHSLRPLPATVKLPQPVRLSRGTCLHQPSADIAMKAQLAEDNFVGRAYTSTGIPAVARSVDGAARNARAMRSDLKLLTKTGLKPNTRLAVGGKVLSDADSIAFYGEMAEKGVAQAAHKPLPQAHPLLTQVHRAGAVGNLVLAGVTLPSLAVCTVTKTAEAIRLTRLQGADKDQRRNAWRDALYAQVGLVSMGSGVTGSLTTLAGGSLASPFTRTAQALTTTDAFAAVDKASRVLAPVADGAMLVADALNLRTQLKNPKATGAQKARAWFNVGIDGVKVAAHFFPKSPYAKTAYAVAGFTQFGLALYDMAESRPRRQHLSR